LILRNTSSPRLESNRSGGPSLSGEFAIEAIAGHPPRREVAPIHARYIWPNANSASELPCSADNRYQRAASVHVPPDSQTLRVQETPKSNWASALPCLRAAAFHSR